MKQIGKLQAIIATPKNYGLSKNSRAYGMICEIAKKGVVCTGYSWRRGKWIETGNVVAVLQKAGIACRWYNDAPRGGACGEHVALKGKVLRDVLASVKG